MTLKFPCLAYDRVLGAMFVMLLAMPRLSMAAEPFATVCGGQQSYMTDGWKDKIIEGDRGLIADFPWVATLAQAGRPRDAAGHLCGAVIIGDQFLLTAAHCVWDCAGAESKIVAYAGGDVYGNAINKQETALVGPLAIKKIYVHEGFAPENNAHVGIIPRNDIAIVQLAKPIPEDGPGHGVAESAIPATPPDLTNEIETRRFSKVAGFGRKSAYGGTMRQMQMMEARIYDDHLCNLPTMMDGALIPGEMICVGDADSNDRACKGDSGGGLVDASGVRPIVLGLVSWKHGCDVGEGLGAYTNVANYDDWIAKVTSTASVQP